MIGADICALANGAALEEKDRAYFLWGISDDTHALVGTTYDLLTLKKGNEELENWLRRSLRMRRSRKAMPRASRA